MTDNKKTLREKVSQTSPKEFIYPGIIVLFFIIVIIVFFISVKFLTKNINNAFWGGSETSTTLLNADNYALVAKKLNIDTSTPAKTGVTTTNVPEELEVHTQTPEQNTTKEELNITILNATSKSGLAGGLAKQLETAGFTQPEVGNEASAYSVTTIYVHEGVTALGPVILEEVKKTYPDAIATSTSEDMGFDVKIIIGGK